MARASHFGSGELQVDGALDHAVLDALNALPAIYVVSTCVGHPGGASLTYLLRCALLSQLAWPFLGDPHTIVTVGTEELDGPHGHIVWCRLWASPDRVVDGTTWFHQTAQRVIALERALPQGPPGDVTPSGGVDA